MGVTAITLAVGLACGNGVGPDAAPPVPEVRSGDVTWHDLRHTFAVYCAKAGVPMPTLKAWMGHSRLETTMRYAIYAPPERSSRYMADMGLSGDPTRDIPTPGPTPDQVEELSVAGVGGYEESPAPPRGTGP